MTFAWVHLTNIKGLKGDTGPANPEQNARFEALETLTAEPGSRVENLVPDPKPVAASSTTFGSGRADVTQAPGWGRATCNEVGATSFYPFAGGTGAAARFPGKAGEKVASRVVLRGHPTLELGATLTLIGYRWDGAAFVAPSVPLSITSGQLKITADTLVTFEAFGTIPTGTDATHFLPSVSFRRWAETYPQVGDFLYFRQWTVQSGSDAATQSPVAYIDGDSPGGYWLGDPDKSASISLTQRLDSGKGALRRAAIVDAGLKRRGGIIGTNGLPAVALRFDHHLPSFESKVLPLLQAKRLPWGQALNANTVQTGGEGMTFAEIATACHTSGGEIWNHSWSHVSYSTPVVADQEVTQGLTDLKAGLPTLHIDGWAAPGQSTMMGMEGSDTPEKFWDTYPGRLVLSQHAFVRGYYPGIYQPMTASPNLVGATHSTIDTLDDVYVSGVVRGAINAGAGLTLMLHPNYLDTAGYMTTAELDAVLTDIATKRDNGELIVLTPSAILMADAGSAYRRNLLTTGAADALAGTWTETVTSRSVQAQYGVPHELVVTVKALTTGTVTLTLAESAVTKRFDQTHTVTITAGAFATLRCLATFPLDTAGVIATLTGNIDHSDIHLHAV